MFFKDNNIFLNTRVIPVDRFWGSSLIDRNENPNLSCKTTGWTALKIKIFRKANVPIY